MKKDEAASALVRQGFDAINSEGVVIVRYTAGDYQDIAARAKKAIGMLGYEGSWGVICKGRAKTDKQEDTALPAYDDTEDMSFDAEEDTGTFNEDLFVASDGGEDVQFGQLSFA